MLTGVLAKKLRNGIGVSPSYQVQNPGAMKAHGTAPCSIRRKKWAAIGPFVTARPFEHFASIFRHGLKLWTAKDFRGHHCKPQGIKDRPRPAQRNRQ
jgi:hypothetical protein